MMTMKLKGKTRSEAAELSRSFHNLVTTDNAATSKQLGDLQLLQGVRKFPQRVKCAMLAWRAIEQALSANAGESTVSTESESSPITP
jgi:nitrogen fixation NifU-like protein